MTNVIQTFEMLSLKTKLSAVLGHIFVFILISGVAVLGSNVCFNCGIGSECPGGLLTTASASIDLNCWQMCDNLTDCQVATIDGSGICSLYSCSSIIQKIGGKTYQRSNNTDCPDFEIYVHTGFTTNCVKCAPDSSSTSYEFCLQQCLYVLSCRATSFDATNSKCEYFTNPCSINDHGTDLVADSGKTLIERLCFDEQPPCIRQHTQSCVNCKAGILCQTHFNQIAQKKPLSINTAVVGVNSNIEQIWYTSSGSKYMYMQCPYVSQAIGDTVYRASCTQDCPKFEILTLPGHRGICSPLSALFGIVTSEFCLSKCLDMATCRGVTFDKNIKSHFQTHLTSNTSCIHNSCTFHNCSTYVAAEGFNFVARRCLNDPVCDDSTKIIQTCFGCSFGPNCPLPYLNNYTQNLATDCMNMKVSDVDSVIVHYKRINRICSRYQCSQVQQAIGQIVYRDSCNTDCQKFEIFQLDDHVGSCDVIYSEAGGFTLHYCIEKCLDLPGCRGTTFNSTTGRCDYHNCTNRTAAPGLTFMWKRCIDTESPRTTIQMCLGCSKSNLCQVLGHSLVSVPTWQNCKTQFENSTIEDIAVYNALNGKCELFDCTLVKQHANQITFTVFRRSPSTDCPIFKLSTLVGYHGTCPVIDFDEGGVTLDYCIDRCLDMPDCRAVSHDDSQLKCFYHNCIERDVNASYTFVKRECMTNEELNPLKPYVQTCKNCISSCTAALSVQTSQKISTNCNTTCDDCNNVYYNPVTEECKQFQCDYPVAFGKGSTLMRKTANLDCLNFELFLSIGDIPNCEAFGYDEGVHNMMYCFIRCLDITGCRSMLYNQTQKNCTYHACADITGEITNHWLFVKKCASDCLSPTIQTCFNCREDTSMCPSHFYNLTTSDSSCKTMSETETNCKGAVYDNSMECQLFECGYVNQQYGSIFYRKSCNNDCSRYEIYVLEGYKGTCDVIAEMNASKFLQIHPEICYERCLDTPDCRGVTFIQSTLECKFHVCNCHTPYTEMAGARFMWKYCLDDEVNATILPQGIVLNAKEYLTSSECKPQPIYIMPCACSSGSFGNMTTEEIAQQLVVNLTIDADTTSASIRKLTSAEDNRPTSVAFGYIGVVVIAGVAAVICIMDVPNLIRTLAHIGKQIEKMVNPRKTRKKRPKCYVKPMSSGPIEAIDHIFAKNIDSVLETDAETQTSTGTLE